MKIIERITSDSLIMGGEPCIRSLRVTVANILRLLAAGNSRERIIEAYPYLEAADIDACLQFTALAADHEDLALAG